jgi:HK97 family phage prohead protease
MTIVHKSYPIAQFKALPNEGEGTCEAIVSVFGNVDFQGDRVVPGAFEKSIQAWKNSGAPVPVLWSHDWGDPFAHIGYVDPADMKEIQSAKAGGFPGGLYVKAHFDVHKPFAKQVYDLLSENRVKEWSFSYDIPAGGEQRAKDGANELIRVDVIEVGPTLKGANPATVTLGTKNTEPDTDEDRRVKVRLSRAVTAQLENELAKAEWSGDRAMGMCSNAADFRKIAFERANDSDPDTAAHWALPHHMGPNADANSAGVSAALAALNGARGGAPDLKNKSAAQSHLEAHQGAESKAAGDPSHLISWYNDGADGAIDWGSDGDWQQCVDVASNYMSEDDAKGFCELRHQDATGMTTAEHAHEGKAASKPWHVEKRGEEYCVIKDADNSQVSCHPTREEADAHVRALYANEKAFDPAQHRGPNGEWTTGGGGDGGLTPAPGANAPGGADRKHTPANDAEHPLGEGTLNTLRLALGNAGMPKADIEALVQKMRDDFHQTGKINIPREADKVLPTADRARLGEQIRTEAEKRGWDPKTGEWHPKKSWSFSFDGEKAGRVIGAKAAAALKDKLSTAVDDFVNELNGSASTEDTTPPAKAEVIEEGDKKDFAIGYADGAASRPKTSEVREYVRGYDEGIADRANVEAHELDEFKALFAQLEIKSNA